MFSHIQDFATFNTLNSLEQGIRGQKMAEFTKVVPQNKKKTERKRKNDVFIEFNRQSNILIAIQNSPKLLKFLNFIRKPSAPLVFMYIEEESYLTFIVNSSMTYPIVIAKFPIADPYIYARNTEKCFNFPIETIKKYINKKDIITNQYYLIIKNEDSKVLLEYKSINCDEIRKTSSITQVDKDTMLQNVFFGKIMKYNEFEEDIGKQEKYLDLIDSMNIKVLSECTECTQIDKVSKLTDRSLQELIIDQENINLHVSVNDLDSTICLISKTAHNLANQLIFWSDGIKPMKLTLIKSSSLFRSPNRLLLPNDFIYYALCEWKYYEEKHLQTYMLVKIITNQQIQKKKIISQVFREVFNDGQTIYEFYLMY